MFYVRKTLTCKDEYDDYEIIYFQNTVKLLGFVPHIPDMAFVKESDMMILLPDLQFMKTKLL